MKRFFYTVSLLLTTSASFFSRGSQLYSSRFIRLDELTHLLTRTLERTTSLLFGTGPFRYVLNVKPTKTRQELGNLLVVAPPRSGKSVLAVSQLLTWEHSCIVNDIKGELFAQTAGYRSTLGNVYVIDPVAGVGHRYDPFAGRTSERELYTLVHHLLFDPTDRDPIFIERAKKMLTQMTRAARLENTHAGQERYRMLPYIAHMLNTRGLKGTAEHLQYLSPELATKFLSGAFTDANFDDDRFLLSCWGTLNARLWPLLTDDVLRCFDGSDFSAGELSTGKRPATVYLRIPESELSALSPLVRLLFGSLIDGLTTAFDTQQPQGKNCRPVLVIADEAGKTAIPMLSDAASTVVGRRISLWIAVQSLSQLETVYGKTRAQALRDTVETQLYYRPTDSRTAKYLEDRLGRRSDYARSSTRHNGQEGSEGLSEQGVPLMTAQQIQQLGDEEILGFHRNLPPFRAHRMDWRAFPLLRQRRSIPPPALKPLPALSESLFPSPWSRGTGWPRFPIDPNEMN
jgi:type IV secretion system protein VirD4